MDSHLFVASGLTFCPGTKQAASHDTCINDLLAKLAACVYECSYSSFEKGSRRRGKVYAAYNYFDKCPEYAMSLTYSVKSEDLPWRVVRLMEGFKI